MNIAYIGNYIPDIVNGVAVVGYSQAKALTQAGHKLFFYYKGDKQESDTDANGIVRRRFVRRNYRLPAGLYDFLKQNPDKIDVFHLHGAFYPFNGMVCRALIKLNYKYVFTPHGGYNENIVKKNALSKSVYRLFFENTLVKHSKAIFCVAEREADDLKPFHYQGLVEVVHNPIELPDLTVTPKSKAEGKTKSIVYFGRYDIHHKGLDILLRIFKHIEDKDANIKLNLYGKGPDHARLEQIVSELGLKNAKVNGPKFGPDKQIFLTEADLYMQTSRWEAGGTAIAEASMFGLPVATSAGYYLADFFAKQNIGIKLSDEEAQAADQVLQLLHNQAWMDQIRSQSTNIIADAFSLRRYAETATAAYEKVLKLP